MGESRSQNECKSLRPAEILWFIVYQNEEFLLPCIHSCPTILRWLPNNPVERGQYAKQLTII